MSNTSTPRSLIHNTSQAFSRAVAQCGDGLEKLKREYNELTVLAHAEEDEGKRQSQIDLLVTLKESICAISNLISNTLSHTTSRMDVIDPVDRGVDKFLVCREYCEDGDTKGFDLIGPFATNRDAAAWGDRDQEERGDNPCWNVIRTFDPVVTLYDPSSLMQEERLNLDGIYIRRIDRHKVRGVWMSPINLVGPFISLDEACGWGLRQALCGSDEWQAMTIRRSLADLMTIHSPATFVG